MVNLAKWGICLKVLPLGGLFAIVKTTTHYLNWEPWTFNSLTAALLSAAIFTIALVLSGTLADYRASEGMPLQIANALETIADTNQAIAGTYAEYAADPLREGLVRVNQNVLDWLETAGDFGGIDQSLDQLNPHFAKVLAINGTAVLVNRMQTEQAKVRSIAWQMQVNRDTDFVQSTYVLLWLFLWSSTIVLLLIGTDNFNEDLLISTFIFISFFYLLFLIRDLDNPFQYDGKSSVDVDLAVLHRTRDRLKNTI
jgi:hypothetical protein